MNKEYLEALNGLFDLVHCQDSFEKAQKYFDIIEQALNRLESIDNAEPSEALKCLERIGAEKLARGELIRNDDKVEPYLNTIKQALLKSQEQEAKFLDNLQRWFLLLGESGANTKYKVRDEMEAVIDELKEVLE